MANTKKYKVVLSINLVKTVESEASSVEEALKNVQAQYDAGQISIGTSDFNTGNMQCSSFEIPVPTNPKDPKGIGLADEAADKDAYESASVTILSLKGVDDGNWKPTFKVEVNSGNLVIDEVTNAYTIDADGNLIKGVNK